MAIRVAINGFGRIGRNVLRAAAETNRKDIEFVAINDLTSADVSAHLFRYDSVHGPFHGDIKVNGNTIDVGAGPIQVLAERDPANLPWKDLKIDIAFECTGLFNDRDKAAAHLKAGAKRVLISAPATGADMTVVYGVNHDKLEPGHEVVRDFLVTLGLLLELLHGCFVFRPLQLAVWVSQDSLDHCLHALVGGLDDACLGNAIGRPARRSLVGLLERLQLVHQVHVVLGVCGVIGFPGSG